MEKIIGPNPVMEALKNNRNIDKIEVFRGANQDRLAGLLAVARKKGVKVSYTGKRLENSQGVVAYLDSYDYYVDFGEFLEKLATKKSATVLILDGIQDPRNLGALIRSCEIFDVCGIIIPERSSVRVNETVVKTSTGAIEYVDIVKVKNISEAIVQLKKLDFWVYGAEASGKKYYHEENYPKNTALVLGSEGFGIRKKVKDYCDILIKIPVFGKINSLNVSVAGGILLSEISKNRL